MKHLLKTILDFLFPPRCSICKREGDFLCEKCIGELKIKPISNYLSPKPREFKYLDGVIYGLDYDENPSIRSAIAQFKYKFTQDLADQFGRLISQKLDELNMVKAKQIVLIPVPLHKKRLRYRGFNQAERLAESVKEKSDLNIQILPLLKRVKHTSQQAKLGKKERHQNLNEAFSLSSNQPLNDQLTKHHVDPDQAIFFLVDDICTTGATLENCAAVLKSSGLPKIYSLVVGRVFK